VRAVESAVALVTSLGDHWVQLIHEEGVSLEQMLILSLQKRGLFEFLLSQLHLVLRILLPYLASGESILVAFSFRVLLCDFFAIAL